MARDYDRNPKYDKPYPCPHKSCQPSISCENNKEDILVAILSASLVIQEHLKELRPLLKKETL